MTTKSLLLIAAFIPTLVFAQNYQTQLLADKNPGKAQQNPQNTQGHPVDSATPSSSKNSINGGSLKVPPQAAVDSGATLQAVPPRAVAEGDSQAVYVPADDLLKKVTK